MIQPYASKFLTPSKKLRRLAVLLTIYNGSDTSQHKIGKMTRLSSSMVNNYVKELQQEGLITLTGSTNRTQRYHLTALGRHELTSSSLSYAAEIIDIYGSAKREINARLKIISEQGIRRVILFGSGESAEVVYAAMSESALAVVAVCDSSPEKQGGAFNGHTIQAPQCLKDIDADAVIISQVQQQEEIYTMLRPIAGNTLAIKMLFSP